MIIKPSNLASSRREFLQGLFPAGALLYFGCGRLSASSRLQNNSRNRPAQHMLTPVRVSSTRQKPTNSR
jgi:hypothetical protein